MKINSKAINDAFIGVDEDQFKFISTFEMAKKAWKILQNVRSCKLQILATQFETLRMGENETIAKFKG